MPGLLGGYPTALAWGPLPIHQGGDDVNDVRRVDWLSQEHIEARSARLAHPKRSEKNVTAIAGMS
jgi:hypothetical protein